MRKKKIITEKLERLARADENIKKIDIFGLIETYNLLSDDLSKKTFIDVLKYRLANTDGILPPVFTEKKKELEEIFNNGKYTAVKLYSARIWEKEALFNLHFLNRNLEFYSTVFLIFCNLYLKQYEYHQNGVSIAIQPGDYVIDGGGFMGETALVFADDVGEDGRIFSFECSSNNSQKFEMNIDLNLRLKNRIQVIERALWNNSNNILHLTEQGGGAFCSTETSSETVQVQTIAIDDFMAENNIPKLDLIKLDI